MVLGSIARSHHAAELLPTSVRSAKAKWAGVGEKRGSSKSIWQSSVVLGSSLSGSTTFEWLPRQKLERKPADVTLYNDEILETQQSSPAFPETSYLEALTVDQGL